MTAAVSLTTRSPSLTPRTARPALATVPPNSWPSTTGTLTAQECVAWNWWTSDPQTETAPTSSSTSCSPNSGTGISRSSTDRGASAYWTTAGWTGVIDG